MLGKNCPISNHIQQDNATGRYLIPDTNLEFHVRYRASELESVDTDTLFLRPSFLRILEDFPTKGTENIYVDVFEDGGHIGRMFAQSTLVEGAESLNWDKRPLEGVREKTQHWLAKNYNRRWFVVGNLLLTGSYGLDFPDKTTRESFIIMDTVAKHAMKVVEKDLGHRFTFLFYKDFTESESAQADCLRERKFHCFKSDPTMVMELDADWETFADYLDSMSSKYRVRAKRAEKKGKDLLRRELDAEGIAQHQGRIYELYQKIAHSVDFNLVHLHPDYFLELKKRLPERFKLMAYFLGEEMVGYFTTIRDDYETHAHYLGLDQQYNSSHQLYLNILYDIVRTGIAHRSQMIDFARTAPEIKSSVGAVPKETYLYIRHRNNFWNRMVPPIISRLQREEKEIIYRSPFKDKPKVATSESDSKVPTQGNSSPSKS